MTNLHIEYFLEVAKQNSFTKAAEKLYVAQPSISRQISNLEKELGITLFDRTKNTIQLTVAGKIMFDFFSDTQDAFSRALSEAKASNQELSGTIKVGLPSYFNNSRLWNRTYSEFVKNYPNIHLQLHIFPIRPLLEKLNANELDIILCYDNYLKNNQTFHMFPALSAPGYLFYHVNNPLAQKPLLTLQDFKDQTLYTLPVSEDPYCKKSMLDFCAQQGFIPARIHEAVNTETLLFSLTEGSGYTLFSDWLTPLNDANYRKIPIEHMDTFSLFWKKNNENKALHTFANEFQLLAQSDISNAN